MTPYSLVGRCDTGHVDVISGEATPEEIGALFSIATRMRRTCPECGKALHFTLVAAVKEEEKGKS